MINTEIIDEVTEALLLVSGDGLKISDIAEHLGVSKADIKASAQRLKEKYSGKSGIYLLIFNDKLQFASNPAYSDLVALVLSPIKERDLSTAALETLAIIAYRQPVTRLEIEQIRGVNSEYTVQMLLKHNLIEVVGRKDVIGKPLLFGTAETFLKRFRLESIEQLPDYDQLLDSIKVIESETAAPPADSLYNEFEIKDEMPDFLKDEKVERVESAASDSEQKKSSEKEPETSNPAEKE